MIFYLDFLCHTWLKTHIISCIKTYLDVKPGLAIEIFDRWSLDCVKIVAGIM